MIYLRICFVDVKTLRIVNPLKASGYFTFIYMLLLPEGQTEVAWEPSKRQFSFGSQRVLDINILSLGLWRGNVASVSHNLAVCNSRTTGPMVKCVARDVFGCKCPFCDRQAGRRTDRQTDRQTGRQADQWEHLLLQTLIILPTPPSPSSAPRQCPSTAGNWKPNTFTPAVSHAMCQRSVCVFNANNIWTKTKILIY
jgi:hypothetical protein